MVYIATHIGMGTGAQIQPRESWGLKSKEAKSEEIKEIPKSVLKNQSNCPRKEP